MRIKREGVWRKDVASGEELRWKTMIYSLESWEQQSDDVKSSRGTEKRNCEIETDKKNGIRN